MYAKSMVQIIKTQSRMYHVLSAYTCHRLHWTDILSKTFTFSDPNSRVQNSFRDLWFPSHKFYNIKQCRLHAQVFPDILYYTQLYTLYHIFRRSRSSPLRCTNTPQRHYGFQHFNSRVSGQRKLYARAHQDIQYQRVKTYIFILSHLGGFNKRV